MKKVAGTLRLDLAQYRELEAFAKFGSDLDKNTQAQLTRGERMVEILKQNQYVPMPVENQVAIIFSAGKGLLDDIAANKVREFESAVLEHLMTSNSDLLASIKDSGTVADDIGEKLENAVADFKKGFSA